MRTPLALALALALTATPAIAQTASPAPAAAAMKAPFTSRTLSGSEARLYAAEDPRLPRVWYDMYLEAGERFVPATQSGLPALAAELLNRGPASIPFETYRRDLFRMGAEISWEATNRYLVAHVKARPDTLGRVSALVRRTVNEPRLDEPTFSQMKERIVNQRRSLNDSMQALTLHYARQKVWGFRPESRAPEGWVESLTPLTRHDVQMYMGTRLSAPGAFVTAAGPLSAEKLAIALAPSLTGWVKPFAGGRAQPSSAPASRQVILIDRPGATDNQIYVISPFPVDLTSRQAAAAEVFLTGMGHGLGARLGKALRVERGLTYHASSNLRRVELPSWQAYSFGGNTQAPQIVSGLFELFAAARTGLTKDEVALAKDQLLKDFANATETPPEQMEAVAIAVAQGLPPEYPFLRPKLIAQVTPEDVWLAAGRIGGMDNVTIVVMGDANAMREAIAKVLPAGIPMEIRSLSEIAQEGMGQGVQTRVH